MIPSLSIGIDIGGVVMEEADRTDKNCGEDTIFGKEYLKSK